LDLTVVGVDLGDFGGGFEGDTVLLSQGFKGLTYLLAYCLLKGH
jgi:hypothetical protein